MIQIDWTNRGDQKAHLGCLPEPLLSRANGVEIYSWVLAGTLSQGAWRCEVDLGRFLAMVGNADEDGACGYRRRSTVSYPTRDAALKAADRAGLLIADHQYDGVESQKFVRIDFNGWTQDGSWVTCPYCGDTDTGLEDDGADVDDETDETCGKCGMTFRLEVEVERVVKYTTFRKEGEK